MAVPSELQFSATDWAIGRPSDELPFALIGAFRPSFEWNADTINPSRRAFFKKDPAPCRHGSQIRLPGLWPENEPGEGNSDAGPYEDIECVQCTLLKDDGAEEDHSEYGNLKKHETHDVADEDPSRWTTHEPFAARHYLSCDPPHVFDRDSAALPSHDRSIQPVWMSISFCVIIRNEAIQSDIA